MLRDITLGQYYPVDSVIHRLDPRTKLLGTLLFIIPCSAWTALGYGLAALFLAMIKLSKVPLNLWCGG